MDFLSIDIGDEVEPRALFAHSAPDDGPIQLTLGGKILIEQR